MVQGKHGSALEGGLFKLMDKYVFFLYRQQLNSLKQNAEVSSKNSRTIL